MFSLQFVAGHRYIISLTHCAGCLGFLISVTEGLLLELANPRYWEEYM
jgi:hypothetical protein